MRALALLIALCSAAHAEGSCPVAAAFSAPSASCEHFEPHAQSWIAALDYCAGTLYMTPRAGRDRLYAYAGVPSGMWSDFKAAPIAGRFFNQQIKSRFTCSQRP